MVVQYMSCFFLLYKCKIYELELDAFLHSLQRVANNFTFLVQKYYLPNDIPRNINSDSIFVRLLPRFYITINRIG